MVFKRFKAEELKYFALTAVIFGFIISFNEWGETAFDLSTGLQNLLLAIIISAVGLYIHHAVQKYVGWRRGYNVEQKISWYTLISSLLLAFLSAGFIKFLAGSATVTSINAKKRIGKYRFGPNMHDIAIICLAGPFASLLFAAILKMIQLNFFPGSELIMKLIAFNVIFAISNLLPIPPLDGSRVLFGMPFWYSIAFGFVLGFGVITYVSNAPTILAFASGILVAAICYWMMYLFWSGK